MALMAARLTVGDTADLAEWRTEIGWPIFRADRAA